MRLTALGQAQRRLAKTINLVITVLRRGAVMASRNVRATHKKHLQDIEVMQAYLNEAIATADHQVMLMALRNIAEAQEDGITGLAERANLSRNSMYKMLSSNGNPKLDTFLKVIHGLGLDISVGKSHAA